MSRRATKKEVVLRERQRSKPGDSYADLATQIASNAGVRVSPSWVATVCRANGLPLPTNERSLSFDGSSVAADALAMVRLPSTLNADDDDPPMTVTQATQRLVAYQDEPSHKLLMRRLLTEKYVCETMVQGYGSYRGDMHWRTLLPLGGTWKSAVSGNEESHSASDEMKAVMRNERRLLGSFAYVLEAAGRGLVNEDDEERDRFYRGHGLSGDTPWFRWMEEQIRLRNQMFLVMLNLDEQSKWTTLHERVDLRAEGQHLVDKVVGSSPDLLVSDVLRPGELNLLDELCGLEDAVKELHREMSDHWRDVVDAHTSARRDDEFAVFPEPRSTSDLTSRGIGDWNKRNARAQDVVLTCVGMLSGVEWAIDAFDLPPATQLEMVSCLASEVKSMDTELD